MAKLIRVSSLLMLTVLALPGAALAQVAPPPPPVPKVAPAPPVAPTPPAAPMLLDLSRLQDEVRLGLAPLAFELDAQRLALDAKTMALDALDHMRLAQDAVRLYDLQDSRNLLATTLTGSDNYAQGKELLNQRRYDDAIARFDKVVAQKAAHIDGALYWKAYAQYKLGKTDESVATIAQLRRDVPQSRYLGDAKVLEADARRQAGQPVNPAAMDDTELKLLAITGIQHTDPERAIPLLEGVLAATNSLRVKKQALYVLALSTQPRAHQILLSYAKGSGNPDLQHEAIRYIAVNRDRQASAGELLQIYQSTTDVDVRMAVLGALRASRDGVFTYTTVGSGPYTAVINAQEAARSAVSKASATASAFGPAEVWSLYEKETNKDLKLQMISLLGSMQAVDQLQRVARSETDVDLRRRALRALGSMKSDKTGPMLVDLYAAEQNADTRKVIIGALGSQGNAESLVALARKEPSLPLKTEIVRRLSDLAPKSKVAADYLMEIIK
jgi:HEAT repeat protein